MKKLFFAMIIGAGIITGYAIEDLTYALSSTNNGNIVITIKNNAVQRVVLNRLVIKNSSGVNCFMVKNFIIDKNDEATMQHFSQLKCFGLNKSYVLDSAASKTDKQKAGNVKQDVNIQTQYTRGFQPDPYSTNETFSLFFK